MTVIGFRTMKEARKLATPENQEKKLDQREKLREWGLKEPTYKKYEELHPGRVYDVKKLENYSIFWHNWIVRCPAFRSDRIIGRRLGDEQCGCMAVILEKDGRKTTAILCPACGYEGEYFRMEQKIC